MLHASLSPSAAKAPYLTCSFFKESWNAFSHSAADWEPWKDRLIAVSFWSPLNFNVTSVSGAYSLAMGSEVIAVESAALFFQDTSGAVCASSGVMPNLKGPQPFSLLAPAAGSAAFAAPHAAARRQEVATRILKRRMPTQAVHRAGDYYQRKAGQNSAADILTAMRGNQRRALRDRRERHPLGEIVGVLTFDPLIGGIVPAPDHAHQIVQHIIAMVRGHREH